jgi:hypothetical protein
MGFSISRCPPKQKREDTGQSKQHASGHDRCQPAPGRGCETLARQLNQVGGNVRASKPAAKAHLNHTLFNRARRLDAEAIGGIAGGLSSRFRYEWGPTARFVSPPCNFSTFR